MDGVSFCHCNTVKMLIKENVYFWKICFHLHWDNTPHDRFVASLHEVH